jgi:hypothetical protein
MAIGVIMDFPGGTLEQYDRVVELMGLTPGGPTPPGARVHWAAATGDGIRVVDVWESREAFDAFAREKIGPLTAEAGLEGPPQMSFHEIHNTFG